MSDLYDVVVVGYGPSGEVAASTLGGQGHRVAVFERHEAVYPLPRMVTFDGEACRTVQATGTDVNRALSTSVVLDACLFGDADADPLLTVDWTGEQCGFPAHNSIFQPDVESTLRERVDAMDTVDVFRGTEVVGLVNHDDHVEVTVRPKGSHEDRNAWVVRAKYVIGADGTNSFVRQAAGIEMTDFGMHERWLNFDMNKKKPLPEQFDKLIMIMDPARPHMYMPLGTDRQRFEMRVADDETDDQMHDPEVAWEFLRSRHGLGEEHFSICRQVVYHYYTKVAKRWRAGRVFIAGDAAHTMTPYMGQGGCSAIRDGRNLAWKLHLVLNGVAEDRLLDEYQIEREPHVTELVVTSHKLAEIVNMVDEAEAAERNYAMRNNLTPPLPPFPKLANGVLHREPDDTVATITGSLAPQGRIRRHGSRARGDDLLGHGFQLISRRSPQLSEAQQRVLDSLGCTVAVIDDPTDPDAIEDIDGVYRAFLDAAGTDAYIMRPDWYIFGVAADGAIGELVDELAARLHLSSITETAPAA
ncbi:bifunctional 3-(3-hydroxy-phenyl)propionate/3-hydroxycinnamic acid hydroxylase [Nocardia sp. NBC_01730]|uniref:bifunctional 3-(3-hydroxy-phenyl)propionate/3-hydroxycinnamic acid hydroxylase n=1 Tax=Nocardia sp. NBC_01730 TaxID=2975998 RepID=UPI002E13E381|nr:bifunctional 3-(3-hydroxy-phenyl)propionate/3-hydroxycinnamic acid hydroxylase [Nocardia sp. NBC_01730]